MMIILLSALGQQLEDPFLVHGQGLWLWELWDFNSFLAFWLRQGALEEGMLCVLVYVYLSLSSKEHCK